MWWKGGSSAKAYYVYNPPLFHRIKKAKETQKKAQRNVCRPDNDPRNGNNDVVLALHARANRQKFTFNTDTPMAAAKPRPKTFHMSDEGPWAG